jgi:hypothetical protein
MGAGHSFCRAEVATRQGGYSAGHLGRQAKKTSKPPRALNKVKKFPFIYPSVILGRSPEFFDETSSSFVVIVSIFFKNIYRKSYPANFSTWPGAGQTS